MEYLNIVRKSERIMVRPIKIEDFQTVRRSLDSQKTKQSKYDEEELDLIGTFTEVLCAETINHLVDNAKNDKAYEFRAFHSNSGSYLGGVVIKTILRKQFQWAEVGYWILNQYWGSGYGSEMVQMMLDIAFNELSFHRVEAHINLDNIASQKTALAAGMKFECIREKFIHESDSWTDNMVFYKNATNNTNNTKYNEV